MAPDLLPRLLLLLQDAAPTDDGEVAAESPGFFWPMLAILGIFWFVMIGPERKRKKKREAMLNTLQKGAKVMTTSGMHGTVVQVNDDVVTLQVADNVRLKFSVQAIQGMQAGEDAAKDAKGDTKGDTKGKDKDKDTAAASEPAREVEVLSTDK